MLLFLDTFVCFLVILAANVSFAYYLEAAIFQVGKRAWEKKRKSLNFFVGTKGWHYLWRALQWYCLNVNFFRIKKGHGGKQLNIEFASASLTNTEWRRAWRRQKIIERRGGKKEGGFALSFTLAVIAASYLHIGSWQCQL